MSGKWKDSCNGQTTINKCLKQFACIFIRCNLEGLAKRSANGIMMIDPNSFTYMHKDGVHRWLATFDEENWKKLRKPLIVMRVMQGQRHGDFGICIWKVKLI